MAFELASALAAGPASSAPRVASANSLAAASVAAGGVSRLWVASISPSVGKCDRLLSVSTGAGGVTVFSVGGCSAVAAAAAGSGTGSAGGCSGTASLGTTASGCFESGPRIWSLVGGGTGGVAVGVFTLGFGRAGRGNMIGCGSEPSGR